MKFFFVVLGIMIAASAVMYYFVDTESIKAMNIEVDDHLGWR